MNRNNNLLIGAIVLLAVILLACCVLAVVAASVGWVADDAMYGPMMDDDWWGEGNCPGCPGRGPVGMRAWIGPLLFVVLGLLALVVLGAVVVGAIMWSRRADRPTLDVTRDVPEVPDIED